MEGGIVRAIINFFPAVEANFFLLSRLIWGEEIMRGKEVKEVVKVGGFQQ